ncbi:trypsin-7-like [Plodia interpunctella]|uniref:trypsin-7-like n=1 Tax=Plodia interpunctella TaxID=58824 RepID=UPI00236823C0|nr:trypsin-7-like [Plodia interpunctella]
MHKIMFCFLSVLGVVVDGFTHKEYNQYLISRQLNGFKSLEIVGGDEVDIKQHPYQVSLYYSNEFSCGGSIVSESYVLTAGHCVLPYPTYKFNFNPKDYHIRVGSSYMDGRGGKKYNINAITVHPEYCKLCDFDYDIAVMKLSTKIALNGITVKTVQLPESGKFLKSGENIVVTGWGDTTIKLDDCSDVLRAVTVPVQSLEHCVKQLTMFTITDRMLCAGFDEGGKDACQGDSGGPAVAESSSVQYGIVSFGLGCARPNKPGVYTNIAAPPIRDWIKNLTGI